MHEMSICEGIIQVLEEQAQSQQFQQVSKVFLEIGALAGVELEALRFGFEVVSQHSIAAGAALEIIELPGQIHCFACGKTGEIQQRYDGCPHCGSYQRQVIGGEELRIKELEVS